MTQQHPKNQKQEDLEFVERLNRYPHLRQQMEEMLETVELKNESLQYPDDAEDSVVDQIRRAGQEMLRLWMQNRHDQICKQVIEEGSARKHEKKSLMANLARGGVR